MVVHTLHLDIGDIGTAVPQPMNDVIHIQQRFMVFGGKPNGHKHDRRCPQFYQIAGGQFGIGLGPLNQGCLVIQPTDGNQRIAVDQLFPYPFV